MELGRECLKIWGYERVDELIWVKTNQLQRIIRTGILLKIIGSIGVIDGSIY